MKEIGFLFVFKNLCIYKYFRIGYIIYKAVDRNTKCTQAEKETKPAVRGQLIISHYHN